MPIPAFDHNQVLPPHLGNPALPSRLSPYSATSIELVQRFGTTKDRINILKGFLNFRQELQRNGLHNGFQWLDGSFLEDIEKQEARSPRDLDLVTIYWGYDVAFQNNLVRSFPAFGDRNSAKTDYSLDHFPFDAGNNPLKTVELTRYWVQLFTHNRNKVWKGMVRIELNTSGDDLTAMEILNSIIIP
jgi:hypothetical protein